VNFINGPGQIGRVFLTFEVDVSNVAVVSATPDLDSELGPANFDPLIISRRLTIYLWILLLALRHIFIDAQTAMHEGTNFIEIRNFPFGHVR